MKNCPAQYKAVHSDGNDDVILLENRVDLDAFWILGYAHTIYLLLSLMRQTNGVLRAYAYRLQGVDQAFSVYTNLSPHKVEWIKVRIHRYKLLCRLEGDDDRAVRFVFLV